MHQPDVLLNSRENFCAEVSAELPGSWAAPGYLMVSFVQYLSAETAECFHSRLILMLHQQWICWPHKETVLKDSSNESVRLWKEYSGMITVDSYIHLKGYGPSVFLVKKSHFLRWICCFFCCSVLFCKVVVQLFTDIYIFAV